jgi:putative membrane protein
MTHPHHADGGLLLLVAVAVTVAYDLLATAERDWPPARTLSFLTGGLLLVAGLTPETLPWPEDDLRTHMAQHLLIGMFAPLCLVLGAPVTLLLRRLPRPAGRALGRLLHTRAVRFAAHPVSALVLNLGGLALLYLTPLHAVAAHPLVHLHFLLAGYLFAWVIAGPDPAPRRPSVPARLVVLGVAIAFHAVFSQLLYAGVVGPPAPAGQRQGAGEIMYYGGDIAELLLAFALVAGWRPRRATTPGRDRQGTKTARTQSSFLSLKIR